MTSEHTNIPNDGTGDDGVACGPPAPPSDELDGLLREWHQLRRDEAVRGRDRLIEALKQQDLELREQEASGGDGGRTHAAHDRSNTPRGTHRKHWLGRVIMNRYSPIVALVVALAAALPFMLPAGKGTQVALATRDASTIVMAPEGGLLEAFDADGLSLGPCVLSRTDVSAEITGRFSRVTVRQTYRNPHPDTIEAVYTFPLSHRAGVDRMTMTIGDRVIVGEVKERQEARRIYEAARDAGRVASLLEQERPNIFTQSVANIEPGATIDIEISYVELVKEIDGAFAFEFPTVVGPRYIPGTPLQTSPGARGKNVDAPAAAAEAPKVEPRRGVVLLGPAKVRRQKEEHAAPGDDAIIRQLTFASPIKTPDPEHLASLGEPKREIAVEYADGSGEMARLYKEGIVEIGGRFGYCPVMPEPVVPRPDEGGGPMRPDAKPGEPFAPSTDKVPDATKITPMPTRPDVRAGHDISIRLSIDTGGAGIASLASGLHEVSKTEIARRPDGLPSKVSIALANRAEIPNRDFVLTWTPTRDTIEPSVFTHTSANGNFFLLQLEPPARVDDAQAIARELVFVIDTSGSMNGIPLAKSREIVSNAINAMRPQDTFNIITFAGSTQILWDRPRPSTEANRSEANKFVTTLQGGGGTEMMKAINAALEQRTIAPSKRKTNVRGQDDVPDTSSRPLRIVMFLTDGYVGNDHAIIDAVKKHRGTTRVFAFGIGNSVNRYLLDSMASAGGGEVEYVLVGDQASTDLSDADAAVKRFNRRTSTPVLTDVRVNMTDSLALIDTVPEIVGALPDLFDAKPLMVLGRYTTPGAGSVTIRGRTASGVWEKSIDVTLPEKNAENSSLPTLWARARIEQLLGQDLAALQQGRTSDAVRDQVIRLGETFGVMSPFTSFVAVDKLRVTIGGVPRLVHVPVELPDSTNFEGFFGVPQGRTFDEMEVVNNLRLGKPAIEMELANALVVRNQAILAASEPLGDLNDALQQSQGGGSTSSPSARNAADPKPAMGVPAAPPAASTPPAPSAAPPVTGRPAGPYGNVEMRSRDRATPAASTTFAPASALSVQSALEAKVKRLEPERVGRRLTIREGGQSSARGEASRGRMPGGLALPADAAKRGDSDDRVLHSLAGVDDPAATGIDIPSLNTIAASQLALSNRANDARLLACTAHVPSPADKAQGRQQGAKPTPRSQESLVADLCSILAEVKEDGELTADQKARLTAIQQEAAAALEQSAKARAIQRKLDERLLKLLTPATTAGGTGAPGTQHSGQAGAAAVEIVVLLSDASDANIAELKALGMEVDSVNAGTRVVAGRIAASALEALALKGFVRRVEKAGE